jgi:hypothetical protein
VTFTVCDIGNNPELSRKTQGLKTRLINSLKDEPLNVKELHQILGYSEATIRAELNRNKDIFIRAKNSDEWGLIGHSVAT